VQALLHDVIEAKVNVRNLLVYFNATVLKLAVNNPHLQAGSAQGGGTPPPLPADSDNAKSHLAKLSPDIPKLLDYLDSIDDSKLFLQNI
jgi:hypothetical protein